MHWQNTGQDVVTSSSAILQVWFGLDRFRLNLIDSVIIRFQFVISAGQTRNEFPALRQCRPLYRKAQLTSRMKICLFLVSAIYTCNIYSQDSLSLNQSRFNQIQSVGYRLREGSQVPIYEDSAFNYF